MTSETVPLDPQTSTDVPALVQAAFQRINAREFDAARPLVERALSLAPHSGMTAHARLHLDTDSCAAEEGAAYGQAFLTEHDPFDGINVHNAWHLAALLVEVGHPSAALRWQERVVIPSVPAAPMTFYSAVTLQWRLEVYGHGRARGATLPWEAMRDAGLALEKPTDLDEIARAMTFVATGDDQNLTALLDRLREAGPGEPAGAAAVAVPVVLGLRAWWRGDYAGAVEQLEPVASALDRLSRFPEHRTPLEDTLFDAQLRTGRAAGAETRLRERLGRQPRPLPRDLFWLGRAELAAGRREEGAADLRAARGRWRDAEPDSPEVAALDVLLGARSEGRATPS
jgi:hypothetical protein